MTTARPGRLAALLAIVVACGLPCRLAGQASITNTLTLSSTTITFPVVVEADYDAGSRAATNSITATFNATKASGPQGTVQRTSIIAVRASAATMGGGVKPVSDLQWRRSDLATWNSLTTTDVTIDSKQFIFASLNNPWSTTVFFRSLLSWVTDSPGTYTATVIFTLTITTP